MRKDKVLKKTIMSVHKRQQQSKILWLLPQVSCHCVNNFAKFIVFSYKISNWIIFQTSYLFRWHCLDKTICMHFFFFLDWPRWKMKVTVHYSWTQMHCQLCICPKDLLQWRTERRCECSSSDTIFVICEKSAQIFQKLFWT